MENTANELLETLQQTIPKLRVMDEPKVSQCSKPDGWSKKEILGHLIDSAANNHQRFVRGQLSNTLQLVDYDQNGWNRVQKYQDEEWSVMVDLWTTYNKHLAYVIRHIAPEHLDNPCHIYKEQTVTLSFVATDYLRHLKHHLQQMGVS